MVVPDKGTLVLEAIPTGDNEEDVKIFLERVFRNSPREKLAKLLRRTPVVLSRNVSRRTGDAIVANLEKLGAVAKFVPREERAASHNSMPAEGLCVRESDNPSSFNALTAKSGHQIENQPRSFHKTVDRTMSRVLDQVSTANKELWLILSMLLIAAVMNYLVSGQQMLLGLYTLPTLFSAYFFGRRHATLTAFASIFFVGLFTKINPDLFAGSTETPFVDARWYDITAWGGILVLTGYATGTLHQRHEARVMELRKTYHGLLLILRQFVSKDKYTENHSYRVSIYAAKIAAYMGMSSQQIEDIRAASLLHDIGKLDISRELLYKASRLTQDEYAGMKKHVDNGAQMLESVGGPLHRIIPIIIAHHERMDGSGYNSVSGEAIPMEARVVAVADVYDSLTSDRPYRKAMSPFDAKAIIVKGAGSEFDATVVGAFAEAFQRGEMEVPEVVVL